MQKFGILSKYGTLYSSRGVLNREHIKTGKFRLHYFIGGKWRTQKKKYSTESKLNFIWNLIFDILN